MNVKIVVVDDQALVRAGLRKIFDADPDLEIVGEASDGLKAVEVVRRFSPDVVVMDIRMPILDGLEATRRLVADAAACRRILILTTFDLDEYVYEALRAGASGFMLKDAPPEDLIAAVRIVARGEGLLAPAVTKRVIERFVDLPEPPELAKGLDELTPREQEVFRLLVRGFSNAEIAAELVISDGTAKTHVARVLGKLDLRDRVHAVIFAYEHRLSS